MEYFYSAWSLVLTGMFQLHIWFTLNFVLSIKGINSIPKVTSLKISSSFSSWRPYKTYYMEQWVDAVTINFLTL